MQSAQGLCGNLCTWGHNVRLHIVGINEPKSVLLLPHYRLGLNNFINDQLGRNWFGLIKDVYDHCKKWVHHKYNELTEFDFKGVTKLCLRIIHYSLF